MILALILCPLHQIAFSFQGQNKLFFFNFKHCNMLTRIIMSLASKPRKKEKKYCMLFKFQLHEKKHPPHVSNIILVLDFIYAKHFQSSDLFRGQHSAKVLTVIRVHCNARRLHRYYVVDDIRRLFIPSN